MARIYPDSKTFVDKKLKFPVDQILAKFNETFANYTDNSPPPTELVKQFVEENFEEGNELKVWVPPDWKRYPAILNSLPDFDLRRWAYELNTVWMNLSRRVSEEVRDKPDLFSLHYVPNGFIIPGGRFKELYYWDTFWIVNGLLICEMVQTARGVIENLLHLVKTVGHVPNGSRVYYAARSQPPMLTQMVESYFIHTGDFKFVQDNIQYLDKEMDYWLENRLVEVEKDGFTFQMFRYFSPSEGPRPESYREDVETASIFGNKDEVFMKYVSLKSAAESGWDFSSRWFIKNGTNKGNLSDITTHEIIPVDLNAFMHENFLVLYKWHMELRNSKMALGYFGLSTGLLTSIEMVLWHKEEEFWLDYDLSSGKSRKYFYLSNFVPLWTKSHSFRPVELTKYVINYITKHGLQHFPGGTPSSLEYSGEQWDFPNAWPPLQAFIVQGLDRVGTPAASELAFLLAGRYIRAAYTGFQQYGAMFEKYDSLISGRSGGGGEYEGQEGFGWTNGLAFEFLRRWGPRLRA